MPIPDYQNIMLPLLKLARDKKEHLMREAIESISRTFNLTDTEKRELLPSGQQAIIDNRTGWARTYLKKAGLIESTRRGYFKITDRGLEVLKQNPPEINVKYLEQFPEFVEFKTLKRPKKRLPQTPLELIEDGYAKIRGDLAEELSKLVKASPPDFFERLVVKLLLKMGYGGSLREAGMAIGKSGDEGVDGIVKEDKLGLDNIYVQAKRWEGTVGRPEIQKFVGALKGRKAKSFQTNATAIVKGAHIKLAEVSFPTVSTEIFLDLEGTGEQVSEEELVAIDYLIGVLIRKDGKEKYIPFLADSPEEEGHMFREFLEWLAAQKDYIIYHWHNYEKKHLGQLAERHGIAEEMNDKLFGKLRDLFKDAVSCFTFPTYGSGLKQVAGYMGFSWRDDKIDAMESAALYFQYVQNPENNRDKLEKILTYNEDDCVATRTVKDWIVAHCR